MNNIVHKHARHRARLHIETGNAAKAAEALGDLPPADALEYLYNIATAYRSANKIDRTMTALRAALFIDRSKEVS